MIEHRPGEEKGEVRVNVKLGEKQLDTGQVGRVVILAEVAGEEGAELDQRVVALVKQLPDELEMVILSLLVDDTAALLSHQQHQRHGQVAVHQTVLQPLARLAGILHLAMGRYLPSSGLQ